MRELTDGNIIEIIVIKLDFQIQFSVKERAMRLLTWIGATSRQSTRHSHHLQFVSSSSMTSLDIYVNGEESNRYTSEYIGEWRELYRCARLMLSRVQQGMWKQGHYRHQHCHHHHHRCRRHHHHNSPIISEADSSTAKAR